MARNLVKILYIKLDKKISKSMIILYIIRNYGDQLSLQNLDQKSSRIAYIWAFAPDKST